jgi:hypothetical protein
MTSDKTQRDAINNQRFKDTYVHASQEPWLKWYPGIDFKLLRATQETGHWTILVNCSKGSSIPRHEHLGAGEYYVISGKNAKTRPSILPTSGRSGTSMTITTRLGSWIGRVS